MQYIGIAEHLPMNDVSNKSARSFSLFEALSFVALLALLLSLMLAAQSAASRVSPKCETLLILVSAGALCVMGAMIGAAIALISFGRPYVIVGAVIGLIAIPLLFFILLFISFSFTLYRTLVVR